MKKLPGGMDGKRGSFLTVEGAESRVVLGSGLAQLDVLADDADDVGLLLDRIGEVSGVSHGTSLRYLPGWLCGKTVIIGVLALLQVCKMRLDWCM
jgi:hypothetical protein